MIEFFERTARSAVDLIGDTLDAAVGGGDGPKRSDVAQLLAAGMTIGAIALALDVSEDVIRELADKPSDDD